MAQAVCGLRQFHQLARLSCWQGRGCARCGSSEDGGGWWGGLGRHHRDGCDNSIMTDRQGWERWLWESPAIPQTVQNSDWEQGSGFKSHSAAYLPCDLSQVPSLGLSLRINRMGIGTILILLN